MVCATSFLLYAFVLPKLPFVRYHRNRSREPAHIQPESSESRASIELDSNQTDTFDKPEENLVTEAYEQQVRVMHYC